MARYPTRQSLQRTVAAGGILALLLATAPVIPTLDAHGALTLSTGAAYAKGKGGGRGRGDKWHAERGEDQGGRHVVGRGRDQNGHANRGEDQGGRHAIGRGHYSHGKFCPPGLAKKGPSCIPPGHRKHHKHNKHWVRGDHIPHDVVYHRVYYDEYRLPRPQSGYFYASIGGDIYLLAEATKRVIEAINLVDTATR